MTYKQSVTAVIPAYNAEKYIIETLDSLIKQTSPIERIIIVDDCSCDGTVQAVESYIRQHDCRNIELYRNSSNSGPSISRNKGIEMAETEWVLFIDADDVAEAHLVEQLFNTYSAFSSRQDSSYVLLHSAYSQIDANGYRSSLVTKFKQVEPDEILGYEFVRNHVYLSGTIAHRPTLMACGSFNPTLRYCEDWDLWLKMAARGGFVYVDEPLFWVRRHSANVSRSMQSVLEGEKAVISQYSLSYIQEAISRRRLADERNALDYISILYRFGYWTEGFEQLQALIKDYPLESAVHFYRGLYYAHIGRWQEAKHSFTAAVDRNDGDAASWNNLGVCCVLEQDRKSALQCFEKAQQLISNYLDCSTNLKWLQSSGEPDYSALKITWRELRPVLLQYES